jgi:hypothetical protein
MTSENDENEKLDYADTRELDLDEARTSGRPQEQLEPSSDAAVRAARPKRAASAKPRATSAKAKPAKRDSVPAPRPKRASVAIPAARKASAAPAARKSVAPRSRRASAAPRADEASIPPVASDLDDEGKAIATAEAAPLLPPPMVRPLASPEADALGPVPVLVVEPRVSPFWKAAAGLAAVACLVLGIRSFGHHASHAVASASAPPPLVEPAVVEPSPEPLAAPAESAVPDSAGAEQTKQASLAALKDGKLDDAIAAGEQATALDPTDADAWLILGAAYQNKGDIAAARRCYRTCTQHATRGEIRECTFLLP